MTAANKRRPVVVTACPLGIAVTFWIFMLLTGCPVTYRADYVYEPVRVHGSFSHHVSLNFVIF